MDASGVSQEHEIHSLSSAHTRPGHWGWSPGASDPHSLTQSAAAERATLFSSRQTFDLRTDEKLSCNAFCSLHNLWRNPFSRVLLEQLIAFMVINADASCQLKLHLNDKRFHFTGDKIHSNS